MDPSVAEHLRGIRDRHQPTIVEVGAVCAGCLEDGHVSAWPCRKALDVATSLDWAARERYGTVRWYGH